MIHIGIVALWSTFAVFNAQKPRFLQIFDVLTNRAMADLTLLRDVFVAWEAFAMIVGVIRQLN